MGKDYQYTWINFIKDAKMDIGRKSGPSILCAIYYLLFHPATKVLFYYRLSHWLYCRGLREPARFIRHLQSHYGCYISEKCIIGKRLNLPHPVGIVIGEKAIVEDDVTIYQCVTLGSHGKQNKPQEYPYIQQGAKIFSGAVLIGNIKVGKNAVIGANAVILSDVPPGSIAVGVPYKN